MQPEGRILRLARKEVAQFFASPIAFVFLGTFLAVCLFKFFWVDAFFARNLADVRPLFEAMPLLLVFLVAALTMRLWSDERRMGTIEFLMTLPVPPWQLVVGKFLACLFLLSIALLLTLPLPVTVSMIGSLDWGPVAGAYLATLFLGASYIAIGLYVSSRNDNQIVSLIITTLVCLAFYFVGSSTLVNLFDQQGGEFLESLSSAARFESITRGVLDIRDLYYYISITGIFLALNVLGLEKQRWSAGDGTRSHHRRWYLVTSLLVGNLLIANLWMTQVTTLRADLTREQSFSVSQATEQTLQRLQEPLLIRGYFSSKTHPLLAPLVPNLRDLLEEFEIVSDGKVRVEFVDPLTQPELEDEANNKYGIRPVPFQISDRYEASLVNSYFNVLIAYGDQFEVIGFRDLIEVREAAEMQLDVRLRNPEYDITKGIKKVLTSFQSAGELFASIPQPVQFEGFISEQEALPEALALLRPALDTVLSDLEAQSEGKFAARIRDPQGGNGQLAQDILDAYGMRPMATSLISEDSFYFYMLLSDGKQTVQVAIPEALDSEALKRNIESGLKRFAGDFTRTVGLLAPESAPNPYGPPSNTHQFNLLKESLLETLSVEDVQVSDGRIPEDLDLLILAAPEALDEKQLFAVDQFLMQGGTVIVSSSPLAAELNQTSLGAAAYESGISEWLAHHGVEMPATLVMDPQNAKFPIPITRNVGGFQFQEVALLDYPYFVDIRQDGLNQESLITRGIPQLTMNWASPIVVDAEKTSHLQRTDLLFSSADSWLSDDLDVTPRFGETQDTVLWEPQGDTEKELLGLVLEGRFNSYFAGKPSPLLNSQDEEEEAEDADSAGEVFTGLLERSAESARLMVFSSNEFLTDQTINITSSVDRTLYLNSLQLIQNAVDWSLEDRDLLSIRSRSHFANILDPLERDDQRFWELLNYGLVLVGLVIVYIIYRQRRARLDRRTHDLLKSRGASV